MDSWARARRRRERRRRIIGSVVAIVAALAMVMTMIAPSFAAGRGYTEFDVHATVHPDGLVDVRIDLEFDFGSEESHGIFLALVTHQEIEEDPSHWRVIHYGDIRAASGTAPADLRVEEYDEGIGLYVGDPDIEITGTHRYELGFTVEGLVNPGAGEGGDDEVYWNVITAGSGDPISNVTVTLDTPAEPILVGCWRGYPDEGWACPMDGSEHARVAFGPVDLWHGEGITVAASLPPGTFQGGGIIYEERATFTTLMGGPGTWITAGIGSLLALIATPWLFRTLRRDEQYLGLAPGLTPVGTMGAQIGRAPAKLDPPVQFTPPPGLTPAETAMIVEQRLTLDHLMATIVDLAVRGYLHIEVVGEKRAKSNWRLTRLHEGTEGLAHHESKLLEILFPTREEVRLDDLTETQRDWIRSLVNEENDSLMERGWFVKKPSSSASWASFLGSCLMLLGLGTMLFLAVSVGHGFLGLPVVFLGIGMIAWSSRAARRTAQGYALYAHALGFKKYLETAEAGQLRFEAGEDIFSRYLPYAIVFGVVQRWISLFEELVAEGEWETVPTWYTAHLAGAHLLSGSEERLSFSSNLKGASAAAAVSAMSGATPGSSGGSAFSGGSSGGGFSGGGFSGGGVGGGSAGSW